MERLLHYRKDASAAAASSVLVRLAFQRALVSCWCFFFSFKAFLFACFFGFLILHSCAVFSLFRFSICCIAESSFELFAGRRLYFSLAFPNAQ